MDAPPEAVAEFLQTTKGTDNMRTKSRRAYDDEMGRMGEGNGLDELCDAIAQLPASMRGQLVEFIQQLEDGDNIDAYDRKPRQRRASDTHRRHAYDESPVDTRYDFDRTFGTKRIGIITHSHSLHPGTPRRSR
jgi:hypothetical protein